MPPEHPHIRPLLLPLRCRFFSKPSSNTLPFVIFTWPVIPLTIFAFSSFLFFLDKPSICSFFFWPSVPPLFMCISVYLVGSFSYTCHCIYQAARPGTSTFQSFGPLLPVFSFAVTNHQSQIVNEQTRDRPNSDLLYS